LYLDFTDKEGQQFTITPKEEYLQSKGYIGKEVINQIKDFKHSCVSYNERNENEKHNKLTPEQESLINQLISNQELRDKYKRFGLCQECQQPNTGKDEFGRRCADLVMLSILNKNLTNELVEIQK